jgi:hypothetical protein
MSVSTSEDSLLDVTKNVVVDCLFKAPKDYSIQNRGDVGSWVWKDTMETLEKNTLYTICQSLTIFVGHGIHITQEYTLNEGFISSIQ